MSRTEQVPEPASKSIEDYAQKHPQLGTHSLSSRLLEAALRMAPVPGWIIDIGCGEGGTLMSLSQREGLNPTLGIELSAHRAGVAAERGLQVLVADGDSLPIPNGCASLIISRHVIEHVEEDVRSLAEMRRVLGQDGLLYLETPLRQRGAWYFYRNAANQWVLDPTHKREYRRVSDLETACLQAGLIPLYANVGPIRFPVMHILHRILSFNRPAKTKMAERLDNARTALRVPRYKEIQLLARPRRPGDPSGPTTIA
jgi:SAM-dependent methyltransferase